MPKNEQIDVALLDKQQTLDAASSSAERNLDLNTLNFGEYQAKYGAQSGTEYLGRQLQRTDVQRTRRVAAEQERQDSLAFQNVSNPLDFVGNLGVAAASGIANAATGLLTAPSRALAEGSLLVQDISVDEAETFQRIREIDDALATNPNPLASAQLRNERRGLEETEAGQALFAPQTRRGGRGGDSVRQVPSRFEALTDYFNLQQTAETLEQPAEALADTVNRDLTDDLAQDVGEVFDSGAPQVSSGFEQIAGGDFFGGLANIAAGASELATGGFEALINNPAAVAQTAVESAGDLVLSVASPALSFASTASRNIADINEQLEEDTGRIAVADEERQRANVGALGAATVAVASDRILAQGGRLIPDRVASSPLGRVADSAPLAPVRGVLSEAPSEALESAFVSGGAGEVDVREAFIEGVIGGGAGGITAGVAEVPQAAARTAEVASELAQAEPTTPRETTPVNEEVVQEVDTTDRRETRSLFRDAQRIQESASASPEQKRESALASATLLTRVRAQRADAELVVEAATAQLQEGGLNDADLDVVNRELSQAQTTIRDSDGVINRYADGVRASVAANEITQEQYADFVRTEQTEEQAAEFITQVTSQIAANPDSVTTEQAEELLETESVQAVPQAQAVLRSQQEIQQAKTTGNVSDDVVLGSTGFRGTNEYQSAIYSAINRGDFQTAQNELNNLNRFATLRSQRAQAFEQATANAPADGSRVDVPAQVGLGGQASFTFRGNPLASTIRSESNFVAQVTQSLGNAIESAQAVPVAPATASPSADAPVQPTPVATPEAVPTQGVDAAVTQAREFNNQAEQTSAAIDETLAQVSAPTPVDVPRDAEITQDTAVQAEQAVVARFSNAPGGTSVFGEDGSIIRQIREIREANGGVLPDRLINSKQYRDFLNGVYQPSRRRYFNNALNDARQEVGLGNVGEAATEASVTAPAQTDTDVAVDPQEAVTATQIDTNDDIPQAPASLDENVDQSVQEESITATETEVSESFVDGDTTTSTGAANSEVQLELDALVDAAQVTEETSVDDTFQAQNQVKKWFVARTPVEGTQPNLLSQNADIISTFTQGRETLEQTFNERLSNADLTTLASLAGFNTGFNETLNSNLNRDFNRRFSYRAPLQYFQNATGDLSQRALSSMSVSAFDWITSLGGRTRFNDDRSINAILGQDSKKKISASARTRLNNFGTKRDGVITNLGRGALANMGIQARAGIPQNIKANLEQALGLAIYDTLVKQGVLVEDTISVSDLNDLGGNYGDANDRATITGVRLVSESDGSDVLNTVESWLNNSRGSSIVSRIASDEFVGAKADIGSAPAAVSAATMSNSSGQQVSPQAVESLNRYNQQEQFINGNMLSLYNALGEDGIAAMLGRESSEGVHPEIAPSIDGKNQTIASDIRNLNDFLARMASHNEVNGGSVTDTPFFNRFQFGKQMRMSMQGTDINVQRAKLHRFMMSYAPKEIDISSETTEDFVKFVYSVAQGMGIGTDKLTQGEVLREYNAMVNSDEVQDALVEIKQVLAGNVGNNEAILNGIRFGGEATHSMKALMSLAEYQNARDAGEQTLQSTILYEIDGRTNGPFNAHVQMGLDVDAEGNLTEQSKLRLAQGGLFLDGTTEDYTEWRAQGNKDIYESTAEVAGRNINALRNSLRAEGTDTSTFNSFINLIGDIQEQDDGLSIGRKLLKNPVTVTVYAASGRSIQENIGSAIIENFYSTINDALLDPTTTSQEEMQQLFNDMATVTGSDRLRRLPSPNQLGGVVLNAREISSLQYALSQTVGKAITDAIDSEFAVQKSNTALVTAAGNLAHTLFLPKYEAALEARREQAVSEGIISRFESLPNNLVQEVRQSLLGESPIINTLFSNNNPSEGIFISKAVTEVNRGDIHQVEASTTNPTLGTTNSGSKTFAEPGAGTMPLANIMAGDATTMSLARLDMATDNNVIHAFDALFTDIAGETQTTEALNQANLDAFGLDLMSEVANMLQRASENVTEYNSEAINEIADRLDISEGTPEATVQAVVDAITQQANKQAAIKNNLLNNNDYHFVQFGGISRGLNVVNGEASPADTDLVTTAVEVMAEATTQAPLTEASDDFANRTETKTPVPAPATATNVDSDILALFEGGNEVNARDASRTILNVLRRDGGRVRAAILNQALKLLPADAVVRIATPSEDFTYQLDGQTFKVTDTRGVFFPAGSVKGIEQPTIYLTGTGTGNGLSVETFMHEILHSATSAQYLKWRNGNLQGEAKTAFDNLESLRQQLVGQYGNDTRLSNALLDVSELISWGLTNSGVIRELEGVRTDSSLVATLTSAAKRIVTNVRKILGFSPRNEAEATAFDAILGNTHVILNANQVTDVNTSPKPQQQKVSEAIDSLSTEQVLGELDQGNNSETHVQRLNELMNELVIKAVRPLSFALNRDTLTADEQASYDMFDTDIIEDVNDNTTDLFVMSDKERFSYNMTRIALRAGFDSFNFSTQEARRLRRLAQRELSAEDFLVGDNTPENLNLAQARYDSLFGTQTSTTTEVDGSYSPVVAPKRVSEFMSNFMALALTNEDFRSKLEDISGREGTQSLVGNSIVSTIRNLVRRSLNGILGLSSAVSQQATTRAKLDALAKNLIHAQNAQKNALQATVQRVQTNISDTGNQIVRAVKARMDSALGADFLTNAGNIAVRLPVRLTRLALSEQRADAFFNVIDDMVFDIRRGKENVATSIWNELKGTNSSNNRIHKLLPYSQRQIDRARNHISSSTGAVINKSFLNELSDEQQTAMTKAVLKTDMSALLDNYSLDEMAQFLGDSAALDSEIRDVQERLGNLTSKDISNYYSRATTGLGNYMATGVIQEEFQLLNIQSIAELAGTGRDVPTDNLEEITGHLETLATLNAIARTEATHRNNAREVLLTERNRTDENHGVDNNGFLFSLRAHRRIKEDAATRTFNGSERLFIKGYTRELNDPNKEVRIATLAEEETLRVQGFKRVSVLTAAKNDPNKTPRHLYVANNGGRTTYLQGVMSNMTQQAKGTTALDSRVAVNSPNVSSNAGQDVRDISNSNRRFIADMFNKPQRTRNTGSFLVPVLNANGDVVQYRYLMNEANKDQYLGKDNNFARVVGAMAASTEVKENSVEVNNRLMDALKAQYDDDRRANRLANYVEISNTANDRRLRELWRMIPEEVKSRARSDFNGERILVRSDLVDVAFGYRKLSVADIFEEDAGLVARNMAQTLQALFGTNVATYLRNGERGLQNLVSYVKDTVVIRSIVVMVDNMKSNTVQLGLHGVPLRDAIRNQHRAIVAAKSYRENERRIFELERFIELGQNPNQHRAYRRELVELRDEQGRNPVGTLIEEGLLQTISEDAGQDYSYGDSLADREVALTNRLPAPVRNAVKFALVSKDTEGYALLNEMTQMGDFASRFALIEHLTNRAENPLSREDAIQEALDAFVNYDLPTHRTLQYANDIGILWFAKYYMRMQRTILRVAREAPARLLALAAGQSVLGNISDPTDAFVLNNSPLNKVGFAEPIMRGLSSAPVVAAL